MPHNVTDMTNKSLCVPNNHIQIGGRKSQLAVKQSEIVRDYIVRQYPQLACSILALSTLGDKIQSKPLYSFGGKALWTKELEILLLEKIDDYPKLDLIVHSLKDMPTNLPDEFELGCILDRQDPTDALVMKQGSTYKSLKDLPDGSIVGTSSVRRSSQLLKNYPNLKFDSVRGNIHTRLRKLDAADSPYECLILASAGLIRVGLGHRITQNLDAPDMYYAVGQGALGIEIRKDDYVMKEILLSIEDLPTTYCCLAERSLMRYLEGGCSVPIGVHTHFDRQSNTLHFKGIIVSPDGLISVEDEVTVVISSKADAEAAGITLGDLLINKGGKDILTNINFERINQPPSPVPSITNSQASSIINDTLNGSAHNEIAPVKNESYNSGEFNHEKYHDIKIAVNY